MTAREARNRRRAAERREMKLARKSVAASGATAARPDEAASYQRAEDSRNGSAERREMKLARKSVAASGATAARPDEAASYQRAEDSRNGSAERREMKLARKNVAAIATEIASEAPQPITRAEINRANAERSTGPRSPEGKAVASLNAVKTGLTGRTVLLPSDDSAAYAAHIAEYESEYQPVGLRERELVQSLADTSWRLQRIPGLELAIYARGSAEFAETFSQDDPTLVASKIELETFLKYEKQLKNLQLQEARLTRRYEKEAAELRSLQKERQATQAPKSEEQAKAGFVFSSAPAVAFAPSQNAVSAPATPPFPASGFNIAG